MVRNHRSSRVTKQQSKSQVKHPKPQVRHSPTTPCCTFEVVPFSMVLFCCGAGLVMAKGRSGKTSCRRQSYTSLLNPCPPPSLRREGPQSRILAAFRQYNCLQFLLHGSFGNALLFCNLGLEARKFLFIQARRSLTCVSDAPCSLRAHRWMASATVVREDGILRHGREEDEFMVPFSGPLSVLLANKFLQDILDL